MRKNEKPGVFGMKLNVNLYVLGLQSEGDSIMVQLTTENCIEVAMLRLKYDKAKELKIGDVVNLKLEY